MPTQCTGGSTCIGGKCSGLLPAGAKCLMATECLSGFCVDGVCCQTDCTAACSACNLPNTTGSCGPLPAGQDPANECAVEPVAMCGKDGFCDGRGGCQLYASGTSCVPQSCDNGVETVARTCDGKGVCPAGATKTCSPYLCSGTSCATICTTQGQCVTGYFCNGVQCVVK